MEGSHPQEVEPREQTIKVGGFEALGRNDVMKNRFGKVGDAPSGANKGQD
jgi:hypothetical protein